MSSIENEPKYVITVSYVESISEIKKGQQLFTDYKYSKETTVRKIGTPSDKN